MRTHSKYENILRKLIFLLVGLSFLCTSNSLFAQQNSFMISGVVTDVNQAPLPGVNIVVVGQQTGAITDMDGKYQIKVPGTGSKLKFSYIGFATQEVSIKGKKQVNVTLAEDSKGLNEVVVVGYGSMKRGDLTGSIAKVEMDELIKAPVTGFDQAFAGRIAGVQVLSTEGQPGGESEIVIRGANSLTQDNSPLYVIDGFPTESSFSNAVDPADIESIEVLKDASATAIYGARGANGVIIITTKKGKSGATEISYDGYYGFQNVSNKMTMMDGYDFVRLQGELLSESKLIDLYFKGGAVDYDKYRNTGLDFQDYIFRTAPIQNHRVSLRGGNDKTKYSMSGSFMNQEGIIINSGFTRAQGRIALDQQVYPWLKIGMNASYSATKKYGTSPSQSEYSGTRNLMQNVWAYRPVFGSSDGDILEDMFDPDVDTSNDYRVNPIISAKNELRENFETNLISNAYVEIRLPADLVWKSTAGYVKKSIRKDTYNNSETRDGNPVSSKLGVNGTVGYSETATWLNENTLSFKKKIKRFHSIDALGGFTMQRGSSIDNSISMQMLPNESLGMSGLDEGDFNKMSASRSDWSLASFLGRLNYNYKYKYYATASFRTDGSSKFPTGNKWGYFPSASLMWRFSKEKFMNKQSIIEDAKIRVSWGATGNNRVGAFDYYSQLVSSPIFKYYFGNEPIKGTAISKFGNQDLKWETTYQTNLGLDLVLFKGRVNLTADYYWKKTNDLLLNAQMPGSTGFTSVYKNIGSISNRGLELSLKTINIQTRNFVWSSDFNITFNRSKLLGLTENQNSLSVGVSSLDNNWSNIPAYIARVGESLGMMYGYIYEGTYKYDDFDKKGNNYTLKPTVAYIGDDRTAIQPGDMKYRDINGDGIIDDNDRTIIGRGAPVHIGGFNNTFTYKGFDLSLFLQWSYGNDILNANRYMFELGNKTTQNMYAKYGDRWTSDNPMSNIPRVRANGGTVYSDYVVEDGSYLRLKNVTLGYNFPKKYIQKLYLSRLRLYVTAQNLFTFTGYSGMDPEVSVRNSALTPGFDFSAYPRARTFTFGINLTLK